MKPHWRTNLLFILCCLCCTPLESSPLFPSVAAARSANGRFLVIVTPHFKDPNAQEGLVTSTTLKIVELNLDMTSNYGLNTKVGVYLGTVFPQWSIEIPGSSGVRMIPIISDDGDAVAAVQVIAPDPTMSCLTLYRKRPDGNTVAHTFTLTDLWTENELYPRGRNDTSFGDFGGNPRWFAGNSLRFSSDSKELLYRTRWNDQISIQTENGIISRR